jgi:hypothetical protein
MKRMVQVMMVGAAISIVSLFGSSNAFADWVNFPGGRVVWEPDRTVVRFHGSGVVIRPHRGGVRVPGGHAHWGPNHGHVNFRGINVRW